jgi:tetratricopeptide (TPR) repeat protein
MHRFRNSIVYAVVGVLAGLFLWTGCGSGGETEESVVRSGDLNRQAIPQQARSYLIKANDALKQGAYHAALALADSAEQVKPNLADANFIRGRVYTELKQFDRAEEAYQNVLEKTPDYQGIRMNMGNNAFRRGQFREAIRWYQEERERYRSGTVWLHLGRAYDQMEKPDSAVYAYEQAIDFDTTASSKDVRADAHIRLAQVLEDQGKLREGLEHARQAVELVPEQPSYRYVLGSLLHSLGEVEEAARELRRVVDANPDHQSAQYKLGQALIRLGREDEAQSYMNTADSLQQINEKISQLRTLAEQHPNQPKRWLLLGQTLRNAGRFEEAMEAYRVVLSMKPENKSLQMMLANLALRAGYSQQAIQRYQSILRQDSSFTDAWVNLGVVYATSGQTEQARSVWEQALHLEPDNQRVQTYLARLSQNQ